MSESNNLTPIWKQLRHEEKKYEAVAETTDVSFKKCNHKNIKFNQEKNELRCTCGVAYSGPRLHELERALKDF